MSSTRRKTMTPEAAWRRMVLLLLDTREDWRRRMSEAAGLPFGRVRALRRLIEGPLTLRQLADAIGSDAPATTVLVNDLEQRALILRKPHPTNRRAKLVSLTSTGRELALRARAVIDRVPAALSSVAPADLAAFARVVDTLLAAGESEAEATK